MGVRRFWGRFDGRAPRWQGVQDCSASGWHGTYTSGFKQTLVRSPWDSVGTLRFSSETLGIYII